MENVEDGLDDKQMSDLSVEFSDCFLHQIKTKNFKAKTKSKLHDKRLDSSDYKEESAHNIEQ